MNGSPAAKPCGRELEDILGRLVAAGVDHSSSLASLLGVGEVEIGRPLRALLRVGILAADPSGALRLTPRGEAWLQLPVTQPPGSDPPLVQLPALDPLGPPRAAASMPTPLERGRYSGHGAPATRWRRALGSPLLRLVRLAFAHAPRPSPAPGARRAASAVGIVALLALVVESSLLVLSYGHAASVPVSASAPPSAATPSPGARPTVVVATPTPEQWLVVQRTNGLGLVLRPAPASSQRVLLLREGARVRVVGGPIQQAGHAWLPVTTTNGATGWVAGEFLGAER